MLDRFAIGHKILDVFRIAEDEFYKLTLKMSQKEI